MARDVLLALTFWAAITGASAAVESVVSRGAANRGPQCPRERLRTLRPRWIAS